eukprot:XP_001705448.1 Hypothetical protein GL50803_31599 [Giardia lamblia ATCC 50803]
MYVYSRRQETLLRGHSFLDFCARLLSRCNRRCVYYLSHALPRHTNHQQRKPTRPPTTTMTATEIPAMAPVLRPLLFVLPPLLSAPFMR